MTISKMLLYFRNLISREEFLKEVLPHTLKKTRLKITQLEKLHFIKVNELKLTQVELFSFFHFMCVAANASELFCMAPLANFLTFHFQ